MPAYRKPKYTIEQTQELTMRALAVLEDSSVPMTIQEICVNDMNLTNQTPQKMARVLSNLCEMGMVKKTKSKSKGNKMVYAAVSSLENEGYDVNNAVCQEVAA